MLKKFKDNMPLSKKQLQNHKNKNGKTKLNENTNEEFINTKYFNKPEETSNNNFISV